MAERILESKDEFFLVEYTVYGGIEFPRYLVLRETFEKKMKKVGEIMSSVNDEFAKGTPSEDAGDTHGQYHNEVAWYREQDLSQRTDLAKSIGKGLDRAVIIESYDDVREKIRNKGLDSENVLTISSMVNIQYGNDPRDTEQIMLVAPLDGSNQLGFVSIETPLARAIEGKKRGDVAQFKAGDQIVKVKIL